MKVARVDALREVFCRFDLDESGIIEGSELQMLGEVSAFYL